jgi:hypothetical protein
MGVFKRGKNYWIDYYVDGRRKREKIAPDRKLAEKVLHKRKSQIAENKFLDIKRQPKYRFEELVQEYLNFSKTNKKSYYQADVPNTRKLLSHFRGKFLYEIKPLDIEKYKTQSRERHKPATVNRELACLKHMFTKAIRVEYAYR